MSLKHFLVYIACIIFIAHLGLAGSGSAQEGNQPKPSKKDRCPVCGMFVYKYPDWVARIAFMDGHVAFFDGSKDLFKYYHNLSAYDPQRTREHIKDIHVTEWYDMRLITAQKAFYVIGSDVYGPMGRELIPFRTRKDAETFKYDHKGKRILTFEEVTPVVIRQLD